MQFTRLYPRRSGLAVAGLAAMIIALGMATAGARDQYAALVPIQERILGPEHPDTLGTRGEFARWTGEAGDAAGARDQYAALLPIQERILGAEQPETLAVRTYLARWARAAGDGDTSVK